MLSLKGQDLLTFYVNMPFYLNLNDRFDSARKPQTTMARNQISTHLYILTDLRVLFLSLCELPFSQSTPKTLLLYFEVNEN